MQEQRDKLEQLKIRGQKNRKWILLAIIAFVAYKKLF